MLKIQFDKKFKKDYKRVLKRGCRPEEMEKVLTLLASEQVLPAKYRDHALSGNYKNTRECHINPDWLLIYKIEKDLLLVRAIRTGSHSDLF
ncbi:MAG: type II toxin-antitoxin system YafQ family toxin [Candidatus Saccharibacteria bacterium]|nr:type II toxin-antitoxin system YafQ family toxin [Candidatus Saccharibacteria bacterium]